MFKLKTIVTPIALCLSLALSSQVMAKPEHGQHKMMKVISQLSLSNEQKQDIKQILKEGREDRQAKGPRATPQRQDLAALVQTNEWDQSAVETLLLEKQASMAEAGLKRAEKKHTVLSVLTTEQRTQLAHMMEQRSVKANSEGQHKHKGKNKHKAEKRLQRRLSAEQNAAIETIKTENKESADVLKDKLKAFKQAEHSLIASEEFNADEWLSLQAQYKDDFFAMSVLQAKTKHDIWNVLTPEQQSKMQRMMKRKHKGKKQQKEA